MILFQSFACLFGNCSLNGVFKFPSTVLQSGDFTGEIGVNGEAGIIGGLEGVLKSEDVKEFNEELELLLEMLHNPVFIVGFPAFSMLSIKDLTLCLLFWRFKLTFGLVAVGLTSSIAAGRVFGLGVTLSTLFTTEIRNGKSYFYGFYWDERRGCVLWIRQNKKKSAILARTQEAIIRNN